MSKSDSWENGLLKLLFNNTNFAGVGDATGLQGSSTAGFLYMSLHTSDPGEAGNQSTNEATNYSRLALSRPSFNNVFVVSGSSVSLGGSGSLLIKRNTGQGDQVVTHFGIGTSSTGTGMLLYSGALTSSLTFSATKGVGVLAGFVWVTED